MRETRDALYVQLADVLRERIEQGVYPAGNALPNESAICREHQLGLMTVRRSLALLREEGLITTRRGAPSVVRPQTDRKRLSLRPDDRLISRMPSRAERLRLALDPGVPVLEVRRVDGSSEVLAADEIEVVG